MSKSPYFYEIKNFILILAIICFPSLTNAQSSINTASFNQHFDETQINGNSIIMLGEHHYNENFSEVELLIIEKLSKKGFNTLYIEGGTSEAAIYNEYFKSGNLEILENSRARRSEFLNFLKELKKINPDITFKGFDFDRPIAISSIFSFWFKGKKIKGIDIEKKAKELSKLNSNSLNKVKKNQQKVNTILNEFKNSLKKNYIEYEIILGENFEDFKRILNNPVKPNFDTRDKNFAKLILDEERKEGLGKSIFIMGRDHMTDTNSFVPLLLEKLPKIYNISCIALITNNAYDKLRTRFYNVNEKRKINIFETPKDRVIPSDFEKLRLIITMFYNFEKKALPISN